VKCLVVPADVSLDVTLRNEDSVNHNFSVYTLDFASEFTGDMRPTHRHVTGARCGIVTEAIDRVSHLFLRFSSLLTAPNA
jgi:hypothetical protein